MWIPLDHAEPGKSSLGQRVATALAHSVMRATPWNEADLDMSEVSSGNPHPLGGVALSQKAHKTENAIAELVTCWNKMCKTNRVTHF